MGLMPTESASGLISGDNSFFFLIMTIQNGWRSFSGENCKGGPASSSGQSVCDQSFSHFTSSCHFTREKMGKLVQSLEKQLTEKGEEINAYMEKHNIQLKDQQGGKKEEGKGDDKGAKSGGVLVAN